jgi:hypothetical protein
LLCVIANVGPHPIAITLPTTRGDGSALFTTPHLVPADSTSGVFEPGRLGGRIVNSRCNFNRGFVRASAQIVDDSTDATLVVVPDQAVGELGPMIAAAQRDRPSLRRSLRSPPSCPGSNRDHLPLGGGRRLLEERASLLLILERLQLRPAFFEHGRDGVGGDRRSL